MQVKQSTMNSALLVTAPMEKVRSRWGAPDLTTGMYTYGADVLTIKETILYGREGVMPAFGDTLDDMQIKVVGCLVKP